MDNPFDSYQSAFDLMHGQTEANIPFKLKFIKADGSIAIINKCLLRKQTPSSKDSLSEFKMNYLDIADDTYGSCYIPLLLEVENRKIVIE